MDRKRHEFQTILTRCGAPVISTKSGTDSLGFAEALEVVKNLN